MKDVKYCKDCFWYKSIGYVNICFHEKNKSLVDGNPLLTCSLMRYSAGDRYCGTEGKFWMTKYEDPAID
jgi:hypothetical protein